VDCASLQNQTGSLGGFLPLLMGGGILSALAQGANVSAQPQPAASRVPLTVMCSCILHARETFTHEMNSKCVSTGSERSDVRRLLFLLLFLL